MNIVNFGLPSAAYQNPDLWGGNDAPNLAAFAIHWIFFQGKMRGLFPAMFGAGMVIFMERAAARDNSVRAADLYFRRMLWLMAFGIRPARWRPSARRRSPTTSPRRSSVH